MRLTRVQRRSFSALGEIWFAGEGAVVNQELVETSAVLVATPVPFRIMAKSEVSAFVRGLGLSNMDQMDTTDVLRLPSEIVPNAGGDPIQPRAGWYLRVISGMDLSDGSWFAFMGEGQALSFRANTRKYLVKQALKPAGVTVP